MIQDLPPRGMGGWVGVNNDNNANENICGSGDNGYENNYKNETKVPPLTTVLYIQVNFEPFLNNHLCEYQYLNGRVCNHPILDYHWNPPPLPISPLLLLFPLDIFFLGDHHDCGIYKPVH